MGAPNGPLLIGIDAGTSVIKAVAFTVDGTEVAAAQRPNVYRSVAEGGVEQDMARTRDDAFAVIRDLALRVPDLSGRALALGLTGQGDGTWLVDGAGEPVAPAWLWLDARAGDIAEEIARHPSYPTQYATTGTGIAACQQSAQLLWLERRRPDLLARAATAFHCKDWLYLALTGVRATDPSEGCFTFGDFRTRDYAPEILRRLGLGRLERLLPPIVDGVEASHPLTPEAASAIGLKPGTPVVLGYVDVVMTALGGGLYDESGRAGCSILGSTGMHMRLAPDAAEVRLNPERSGYTMPFPAKPAYTQMQSHMAATLNIDWMLDLAREVLDMEGVRRTRGELLAGLDARVLGAKPGALLFHPYISEAGERGPFMDPAARAQFTGLSTATGFNDMLRAVFEGLAFAARDCYAAMGPMPAEIRLTGGAARSQAMRDILAAGLGAPVRTIDREEAGAAGVAMVAAVERGLYPDMGACARAWVDPRLGPLVAPDPALARLYGDLFPAYVAAREAIRPVWRMLKGRAEEAARDASTRQTAALGSAA